MTDLTYTVHHASEYQRNSLVEIGVFNASVSGYGSDPFSVARFVQAALTDFANHGEGVNVLSEATQVAHAYWGACESGASNCDRLHEEVEHVAEARGWTVTELLRWHGPKGAC